MLRVKQKEGTIFINAKTITSISVYVDNRYDKQYRVDIGFIGGNQRELSFLTKEEQEQFISELMFEMDKG